MCQTLKAGSWSINILQGSALKERGKALPGATLLPLGRGCPQPSALAPNPEHRRPDRNPLLPLPGGQQTNKVSIWPGSPWAISWASILHLDQAMACAQVGGHAMGKGGCPRSVRDLPPKAVRVFVFWVSQVLYLWWRTLSVLSNLFCSLQKSEGDYYNSLFQLIPTPFFFLRLLQISFIFISCFQTVRGLIHMKKLKPSNSC